MLGTSLKPSLTTPTVDLLVFAMAAILLTMFCSNSQTVFVQGPAVNCRLSGMGNMNNHASAIYQSGSGGKASSGLALSLT